MDLAERVQAGRHTKAAALARDLRRHGVTADQAIRFTRAQQLAAARRAKVNPPSADKTWRTVVAMLAGSAAPEAACPTCNWGCPGAVQGPPKPFGHDGPCAR
jgi:uncharacterized lipoprotein NlpE involved in copper resistance